MKDGRAVLLAPLLACGGAPSAPEWVSLGKIDDGIREIFVDVSNIRIAGSIRSTWVKFDYTTRTHTLRDICGIGLEDFPKPMRSTP